MDGDTGQRGTVSAGATDTSFPAPHPRGLHPALLPLLSRPPCRCCNRGSRGQPGSLGISWTWRPVTPPCLQPPQKANRTLALEAPCFPTHFQINSRCQLPCRAHQLGPQTCSHPCLTRTPHCLGHHAAPSSQGASGAFSPCPLPPRMPGLGAGSPPPLPPVFTQD